MRLFSWMTILFFFLRWWWKGSTLAGFIKREKFKRKFFSFRRWAIASLSVPRSKGKSVYPENKEAFFEARSVTGNNSTQKKNSIFALENFMDTVLSQRWNIVNIWFIFFHLRGEEDFICYNVLFCTLRFFLTFIGQPWVMRIFIPNMHRISFGKTLWCEALPK